MKSSPKPCSPTSREAGATLELRVREGAVRKAVSTHSPAPPYDFQPGPGLGARVGSMLAGASRLFTLNTIFLYATANAFLVAYLGSFAPAAITFAGRSVPDLLTFFLPFPAATPPILRVAFACMVAHAATMMALIPFRLMLGKR